MPRTPDPVRQLALTIARLKKERQGYLNKVARIDEIFSNLGIQLQPATRGPGRPRTRVSTDGSLQQPARRERRKSYTQTANQMILEFVGSKGAAGATTNEINSHWKKEGRIGTAYVTLGQMVKKGKLKRKNLPGERGSLFTVAKN